LHAADLKQLEVFHHRGIHHILNTSKWKQAMDRVKKENLRLAMLQEIIEERRLDWLGNVARQLDTNLPKCLLTVWTDKPRSNCSQKLTLRDSNAAAHTLQHTLSHAHKKNSQFPKIQNSKTPYFLDSKKLN
jgi:hypothetical protein